MHCRDLAYLAASLATNAPALLENTAGLSRSGMEQYWVASKCRLDRWLREIKTHVSQAEQVQGPMRSLLRASLLPTLEEILVSEVLTRLFTGFVCRHDQQRGQREGEPIVRSVYIGHLEARNKVLRLLIDGHFLGPEEALHLNRLRRRCENWIDVLLAWLGDGPELDSLALNPERTRQFAHELAEESTVTASPTRGELTLASVRAAFLQYATANAPNGDWNEKLAGAVLSCLPADLFDGAGQFKTLWQVRLEHTARDTQGLLSELLNCEAPSPISPVPARRF